MALLSLGEMCLARVALNIISTDELTPLWTNGMMWVQVNPTVRQRINIVPGSVLKSKLRDAVNVIASHVNRWINLLENSFNLPDLLPLASRILKFKSSGLVDELGTARRIIDNDTIAIASRFVVACIFAMVDDIRNMWVRVRNEKLRFSHHEDKTPVNYWIYYLEGRLNQLPLSPLQFPDEYGLQKSLVSIESTKYFYKRLPPNVQQKNLWDMFKSAVYFYNGDTLIFALKEMTQEQRNFACDNRLFSVLEVFFQWPYFHWFERTCNEVGFTSWLDKIESQQCGSAYQRGLELLLRFDRWSYCTERERLLILLLEKMPIRVREKFRTSRLFIPSLLDHLIVAGYLEVSRLLFADLQTKDIRQYIILRSFEMYVCRHDSLKLPDFHKIFSISAEEATELCNLPDEVYADYRLVNAELKQFKAFLKNIL